MTGYIVLTVILLFLNYWFIKTSLRLAKDPNESAEVTFAGALFLAGMCTIGIVISITKIIKDFL